MKTLKNAFILLLALIVILPLYHSCKKSTEEEEGPELTPLGADKSLPYEFTDWMHDIPDCVGLDEITIPGTHDSGADLHTSQINIGAEDMVICQHFTLANQLKLGVRWFDIRLRLYNGGLPVHHGPYYLHKNFDDMLHQALNFLEAHPMETVIFMIKQEHSDESDHDFATAVYKRLKANSSDLSKFYLDEAFPFMIDARGKIVIVRRFDNDTGHPLGIHMDWEDNVKGKLYTDLNDYYVQDHYSLNTVPYETKCEEIKDCINKAHSDESGTLYLNFTSGEDWFHTLISHATQINPVIDSYIRSHSGWKKIGVIMVNFAGGSDTEYKNRARYCTPNFVKHIIALNNFSPETVQIGNQVWMKKNLDVSHYRNDDEIQQIQAAQPWGDATTGAWCYYDGIGCFRDHGKLYNWYAVKDPRGLCPEGFHVPTDEEWTTLADYLGGSDVAGGKIKGTDSNSGWCPPNTGATNESGFTAPANGAYYMGLFQNRCMGAVYWTSTGVGSNQAVFRFMFTESTVLERATDDWWTYGASVRCIKDD